MDTGCTGCIINAAIFAVIVVAIIQAIGTLLWVLLVEILPYLFWGGMALIIIGFFMSSSEKNEGSSNNDSDFGKQQQSSKNNSNYDYKKYYDAGEQQQTGGEQKQNSNNRNKSGGSDNSSGYNTYNSTLDSAYKLLGCSAGCTDKELKNAYHTRIKQYHPDNYHGKPQEFQELAKQKTQEIIRAYEDICQSRKIK